MFLGMKQFAGFISRAMEAEIWQDDGAIKLYLYCLSRASHNAFNWHGLFVQPGDMPLAERHVAEALIWSRNKLDRKMKILESAGLITVRSVNRMGTMVHIVHWPDPNESNSTWLRDGARNESSTDDPGSMVEPKQGPGTEPDWHHNETSGQKSGSTMEPDWPHGEAKRNAAGIKMEPNPIEKNRTSSLPEAEPEGFTKVWFSYPSKRRNQRKVAAQLVAKALANGATIESILSALEAEKQSATWFQEDGRFIPAIVNWLDKETWRDFIKQAEPEEAEKKWESK